MEDVALIAELHSLPSADLAPPLDVTPQRKKEKTFEALLRQVEGLSRQHPVLMVFDDLHWIDPSSRELLDRVIERVADWPVLLLAMFRPEFQPPWTGQPHVTMLTLARLDRRDTAAMVANVAGNAALPTEIVEEIAERTDGVPLFVEELTKAVLEAGAQGAAALSAVPHPALSVPATLHASLMARLDRLGPAAKDVAQTGAAIGREFELRAAGVRHRSAGAATSRGARSADERRPVVRPRHAAAKPATSSSTRWCRMPPMAHCCAAGASGCTAVSWRRSKTASRRSCWRNPRCWPSTARKPGSAEKAVGYWLKAGQQAMARSAMTEAVAQLRKGLEVLAGLPDGPWRLQQELDLQIALGVGINCHGRLVGGGDGARPSPESEAGRAARSARAPGAADHGANLRFISCEPSTGRRSR